MANQVMAEVSAERLEKATERMDYFPSITKSTTFKVSATECTVTTRDEKECMYLERENVEKKVRVGVDHFIGQLNNYPLLLNQIKGTKQVNGETTDVYRFKTGDKFVVTKSEKGGIQFDQVSEDALKVRN